ncbi:MAG: FAD-binding protein [Chloroflexi bacterium]|nr:FAD-binding protein [Chloroflexota bacterium]
MSNTMSWPYPVHYNVENDINTDVLVLGGGMAGPMAAITAAKKGLRVVLVDKGGVKYSGFAGSGFDHWHVCPNPASPVTPEEITQSRLNAQGGYGNAIGYYIISREGYDSLVECESFGAKIRDTDGIFKGAEFRDEKSGLLFSNDYVNKFTPIVFGRSFKPALYNELQRTGVKLYDRVMTTCLLTEGGKQGTRVVGATGVNTRTGEFYVFRAKATIICLGHPAARGWVFSTELQGTGGRHGPGNGSGDGESMAWRAGAELTMMEKSTPVRRHRWTTEGSYTTSWFPVSVVDAQGKEIPYIDYTGKVLTNFNYRTRPAPGQKFSMAEGGLSDKASHVSRQPAIIPDLEKRIQQGEYRLPLYCDFPSMPEDETRAIYGYKIAQEGTTWLAYHNMTRAGFDPSKHLLQIYEEPIQGGGFGWRRLRGGGVVIDWNLKTSLDGLYAAGDQIFDGNFVSQAIATGRYAARHATERVIDRAQVEAEKRRIYAPVGRNNGIELKELESGLAHVMQHYCGDNRNEEKLKIGLTWLDELNRGEMQQSYARNPHELIRVLEVFSLLDWCRSVMYASIARKSSNSWMQFKRMDQHSPQIKQFLDAIQTHGLPSG